MLRLGVEMHDRTLTVGSRSVFGQTEQIGGPNLPAGRALDSLCRLRLGGGITTREIMNGRPTKARRAGEPRLCAATLRGEPILKSHDAYSTLYRRATQGHSTLRSIRAWRV